MDIKKIAIKIKDSKYIGWIWLAFVYAILVLFMIRTYPNYVDADMSTDPVLASEMHNSGELVLCKNWIYTTELRVINNQLVFAFLMNFFESWKTIRIVSGGILYLILIATFIFLMRALGVKREAPFSASLLLLPFSQVYYDFILSGLYYIPHISFSFSIMGILVRALKEKGEKKRRMQLACLFIVSFLSGLGGFRQLLILFFPLLVTAILVFYIRSYDGNSLLLFEAVVAFVAGAVGCGLNKTVLSKDYTFATMEEFHWTNFSSERLFLALTGWFKTWGYSSGMSIFSKITLVNAFSFLVIIIFIFSIINILKNKDVNIETFSIAIFSLTGIVVLTGLYVVTDMIYNDRYLIPVSVFIIPVIVVFLKENWQFLRYELKAVAIVLLVFYLVVSALNYYSFPKASKGASEKKIMADWLVENGYYNGYSIFWNANILTELSDGQIEMFITDGYDNGKDAEYIDDLIYWGQKKDHFSKLPEGKVFFYMMDREFAHNSFYSYFENVEPSFSSGADRVYCYDSFEDIPDELFKMRIKEGHNHIEIDSSGFYCGSEYCGNQYMSNGINECVFYGPYVRLYPGRYAIKVNYVVTEKIQEGEKGFIDLVGDTIEFGKYQSELDLSSDYTVIDDIILDSSEENVEIRMCTLQKGIKVLSLDIEYMK